jgi:hypothetical protein
MMNSATFSHATLAIQLFLLVGFLFNGMVLGELTDPSMVNIGDEIWCVLVVGNKEWFYILASHAALSSFFFKVMKVM